MHLLRYREGYRPTRAERRELEEAYRDLFPALVPLFTRRELVRVIDRLRRASREGRDAHRLVRRLTRRIEELGFQVEVRTAA